MLNSPTVADFSGATACSRPDHSLPSSTPDPAGHPSASSQARRYERFLSELLCILYAKERVVCWLANTHLRSVVSSPRPGESDPWLVS